MLTASAGRKVVLFSPPYEGKVFGPPLGLLSLASSLRVAGFHPRDHRRCNRVEVS